MTEAMPEYEVVEPATTGTQQGWFTRQNNRVRQFAASHTETRTVTVPSGLPPILASRRAIVFAWAGSMGVISWDEWHNNHILPRPARLWYATAFYLMLVILSMTQWTTGIANALAIGYFIMLVWEYFNGSGQFSASGQS